MMIPLEEQEEFKMFLDMKTKTDLKKILERKYGPKYRLASLEDNGGRLLSQASAYNLLAVILSYEREALYFHEGVISKNMKQVAMGNKSVIRKQNAFAPRSNGSANPGIRNSDGHRGGPTFEQFGCVASASEIGKQFGCLHPILVFERIQYLADCGLVEYETYKPKYKKQNLKERPYWFTKLKVTEKGKRYLDIYKAMIDMLLYYKDTDKV